MAAAQDAAAVDAATARAADQDGGEGATDHLEQLLTSLPTIEQAKGVLMGYYNIDADTAFRLLQRWSQTTNTKLTKLADQVISAVTTAAGGEPWAGLRSLLAALARPAERT